MEQVLGTLTILLLAVPNSSSATTVQNDDAENSSGSDESGGNGDEASGSLPNVEMSTQSGHDVVDIDIRYERMYRQSHDCPGPPDLHTDLPLAIGPAFSLEHMYLQDDLQREAVTRPSDPPGQQSGLSSPNEVERSVPILYVSTLNTPSNLSECLQENKPATHNISNVPKCTDQLFTQIEHSPLKLHQELVHHQRPLLSHVPDYSVPDQDQQPSNHYNQQRTDRGAQSEVLDNDEHHTETQKKEKEQTSASMPIKATKGEHRVKQVKFSEDVKIDKSDDSFKDVQDLIKQIVKHELKSKKSERRLCDAVIVYDKNDYEYALDMRDTIQSIVVNELNQALRIELFDDAMFIPSHVQVVTDVLENASVVLVYLSRNAQHSRGVQFFIEEAVVMTRIDPIDQGALTSVGEFRVRPVHSQPPNQRNYRTPPGLASVSGIDWFDKSKYTFDRIVAIMRNAIRRRNLMENPRQVQREFRQTSLRTGSFSNQPHHGEDASQHALVAGACGFTTSGEQYTHQAPTAPRYMETRERTQRGFYVNSMENMTRRINLAPNHGATGYSYPRLNPGYRHAWENVDNRGNHSRVGDRSNFPRPIQIPLNEQSQYTWEGEIHASFTNRTNVQSQDGYDATNQQRPGHLLMQRAPLNEHPQHRREGGDEIHSMRFANDGLRTQTSRINSRTADGYSAMIQPHPRQPAMQMAPSLRQQRPIEYSPGHMQQQTQQEFQQQQQQQQQPLGQIDMGRGTSEVLDSNLSTNDLEIDYPTSSQERRRMYDQGPSDNDLVNRSIVIEGENCDPANVSDVD